MATLTTPDVVNNADVDTSSAAQAGIDNDTDFDPLSPADAQAIVLSARGLLLAASTGEINSALKGKQWALMCANDLHGGNTKAETESTDAAFFRQAATRLGGQVALIRPRLSDSSSASELRRLVLMLGRLYDAVECQGMPLDLVQKIRAQAGLPVYFGLASAAHPTAALVNQLEGSASPRDKRLFILQASLLRSLALA
jgi:ornithine carbamoyltransferase